MIKPKIQNILLFIFVKYLVFYILLMFKNENYALVSLDELNSFQDVFYYLVIFLTLPIVFSILLLLPIYKILKLRNLYYFIGAIIGLLIFEYFVYTYLASQSNFWNGIYNGMLTILFFGLFFYRSIKANLR